MLAVLVLTGPSASAGAADVDVSNATICIQDSAVRLYGLQMGAVDVGTQVDRLHVVIHHTTVLLQTYCNTATSSKIYFGIAQEVLLIPPTNFMRNAVIDLSNVHATFQPFNSSWTTPSQTLGWDVFNVTSSTTQTYSMYLVMLTAFPQANVTPWAANVTITVSHCNVTSAMVYSASATAFNALQLPGGASLSSLGIGIVSVLGLSYNTTSIHVTSCIVHVSYVAIAFADVVHGGAALLAVGIVASSGQPMNSQVNVQQCFTVLSRIDLITSSGRDMSAFTLLYAESAAMFGNLVSGLLQKYPFIFPSLGSAWSMMPTMQRSSIVVTSSNVSNTTVAAGTSVILAAIANVALRCNVQGSAVDVSRGGGVGLILMDAITVNNSTFAIRGPWAAPWGAMVATVSSVTAPQVAAATVVASSSLNITGVAVRSPDPDAALIDAPPALLRLTDGTRVALGDASFGGYVSVIGAGIDAAGAVVEVQCRTVLWDGGGIDTQSDVGVELSQVVAVGGAGPRSCTRLTATATPVIPTPPPAPSRSRAQQAAWRPSPTPSTCRCCRRCCSRRACATRW